MKEKGFTLKKNARIIHPETITDADYADLILLTNIPIQAKALLYSLEQAARGIGLCIKSDKTKFMCFKQNDPVLHLMASF